MSELKFRLVRLNPDTLTPGAEVLVGTRHMGRGLRIDLFPVQMEVSRDGVLWELVEFVNASVVDDEVQR